MGAGCFLSLDQLCFLQCRVRPVLSDGAKSLGRNFYNHMLVEFWNVDATLLEIWLSAHFATRIELCRTSAIAVAATNLGLLARDFALLCHTYKMN